MATEASLSVRRAIQDLMHMLAQLANRRWCRRDKENAASVVLQPAAQAVLAPAAGGDCSSAGAAAEETSALTAYRASRCRIHAELLNRWLLTMRAITWQQLQQQQQQQQPPRHATPRRMHRKW